LPENIFIVIPAYNEARNIGRVLESLLPSYPNIVVVDDCSNDETFRSVSHYPVHSLRHVVNLGQGAALQTGNEYALKQGADIIVHFDSDGQHRIDQIEQLIQPIRDHKADVVFGSRFLVSQSTLPRMKRYVLLPIGRIVNWLFTGLHLTDAHNGFRAINRRAAQLIQIRQNRMAHATEILGLVRQQKLRYQEVPVIIDYHEFGQSFSGGLKIVRDLIIKNVFK
jgi:glycosyltransferase involved in cell wall biosynthesis